MGPKLTHLTFSVHLCIFSLIFFEIPQKSFIIIIIIIGFCKVFFFFLFFLFCLLFYSVLFVIVFIFAFYFIFYFVSILLYQLPSKG